jgi:hypothetical protein
VSRVVPFLRAVAAIRPDRRRAGLAVHAALAGAGLVALATIAPALHADRLDLLVCLLGIAVVCELSEVWLASGVHFNATLAVAVMALAVGGPLAAFAVLLLPDLAALPVRRGERLLRAGNLANLAAYAWAALAGAGVLALAEVDGTTPAAMPALVSAGLALAVANFLVGPALYAPLQLGVPARRMLSDLTGTLPAVLAVVLAGATTTALIPALGLLALGSFAFVTLVPASALTLLARARPASELSTGDATVLYAAAIADVLRLRRHDRDLLARAAAVLAEEPDAFRRLMRTVPPSGAGPDPDRLQVALVAAHADEHFDGSGLPAGIDAGHIPPLSRVLAVAARWAMLTARGTAELSHTEALLDLEAHSGGRFDPAVVRAAGTVVERDTRLAPVPAAQPRIHAWPGTAWLRARVAPRLLALARDA